MNMKKIIKRTFFLLSLVAVSISCFIFMTPMSAIVCSSLFILSCLWLGNAFSKGNQRRAASSSNHISTSRVRHSVRSRSIRQARAQGNNPARSVNRSAAASNASSTSEECDPSKNKFQWGKISNDQKEVLADKNEGLICCLTSSAINIPVALGPKDAIDQICDYEAVRKWVSSKPSHPYTRERLTIEMLPNLLLKKKFPKSFNALQEKINEESKIISRPRRSRCAFFAKLRENSCTARKKPRRGLCTAIRSTLGF